MINANPNNKKLTRNRKYVTKKASSKHTVRLKKEVLPQPQPLVEDQDLSDDQAQETTPMLSNILEATGGTIKSNDFSPKIASNIDLNQHIEVAVRQRENVAVRYASEIKTSTNAKLLKINKPDLVNLISPRQQQKMRSPPNFK